MSAPLSTPMRACPFVIEKARVTMWIMATTFLFTDGKTVAVGSGGTLVDASAQPSRRLVHDPSHLRRHWRRPPGPACPAARGIASAGDRRAGHAGACGRPERAGARPPGDRITRNRGCASPSLPRGCSSPSSPSRPLDEALRHAGVACVTVPGRRERPEAKDTRFLATAQAAYATLPAGRPRRPHGGRRRRDPRRAVEQLLRDPRRHGCAPRRRARCGASPVRWCSSSPATSCPWVDGALHVDQLGGDPASASSPASRGRCCRWSGSTPWRSAKAHRGPSPVSSSADSRPRSRAKSSASSSVRPGSRRTPRTPRRPAREARRPPRTRAVRKGGATTRAGMHRRSDVGESPGQGTRLP